MQTASAAPSPATPDDGRLNLHGVKILAWTAFALLNILYIFSCLQRNGIPGSIFNDIQSDMKLLGSQVTRISTLYVYTYAAAQFLSGVLIDRFGGKRTGIFGGLCLAAGLTLFSTASTPGMLYTGRIISAFGHSFIYLCIVKIAHLLFPPKQFGALIALSMAFGFTGALLGTAPTQLLSQWFGWRYVTFTLGALFLLTSAAMVFALSRLHERQHKSSTVTMRSLANLLNSKGRYAFVTFQFWTFPAFFVLQSVLGQKFIQDYLGYSASRASVFTTLMTLGSIVACLLGAPLLRLLGNRRMPLIYASVSVPIVVAAIMATGIKLNFPSWVFLPCFALVSFSQIAAAAMSALMSELTDTRTIAFSAAVRNFFPYAGCGIVSGICGIILDRFAISPAESGVIHYPGDAYFWILVTMAAFSLIGLIHLFFIPETRGRHIFVDPYAEKK